MKHLLKRLSASLLALTMAVGMGTAASAATKSDKVYDLYVKDKTVQFLLDGKVAASYDMGGTNIDLITDSEGDFLVCFYDDYATRRGISLGNQKSLNIRGTVDILQVRSSLDKAIDLTVDSEALVKNLKIFSAHDVTIDGRVSNLLVDAGAAITVSPSGTLSEGELRHSKATLLSVNGSTVKEIRTVKRLNVKGKASKITVIDEDSYYYDDDGYWRWRDDDDDDDDKIRLRLETDTIYARKGDTLRDLLDELDRKVYAYVRDSSRDDDGDQVDGYVHWREEDVREELTTSGRYSFTFVPRNSKYEITRGRIDIEVR